MGRPGIGDESTECCDGRREAFLRKMLSWRKLLARDAALRNRKLCQTELNRAVDWIIGRVVFLRACECRGVEPYGSLLALLDGPGVDARLCELLGRVSLSGEPTHRLAVDDGILTDGIRDLYEKGGPGKSALFDAEILGRVYEQFLGKGIRLKRGRQAVVEDRPEVKKAGGVYYTPRYIVDYIVENTVGKLLEAQTPRQAAKLKILDPACGSGSFLLGAYQYLLDWHHAWYVGNAPRKWATGPNPRLAADGPDGWQLTAAEKMRILKNNLFGVDLDRRAVEVARLSLFLRVLEAPPHATRPDTPPLPRARTLAHLAGNVKWGNALIGPDAGASRPAESFDWRAEFPHVFQRADPGFDAVIGNPPYRRELDTKALLDEVAATALGKKYRSARMDLWYYFVHRGIELLTSRGQLSFITNAYWTAGSGAKKLIRQLREDVHVEEIFSLGKHRVFSGVSGRHMVFRLTKGQSNRPTRIRVAPPGCESSAEPFVTDRSPVLAFDKEKEQLFREGKVDLQPPADGLLDKLAGFARLGDLGRIRQGIAENPPCVSRKAKRRYGDRWTVGQGVFALRPEELASLRLTPQEERLLRPYHDLCDLGRYRIAFPSSLTLIYSTRATCPDVSQYPAIEEHLGRFRPLMEGRRETKLGRNAWWHLHWPRDESLWQSPKIIAMQFAPRPSFVAAEKPVYVPFSTNVFAPREETKENILYLCGLLNSRLLWKWYDHHAKRRGVGLEINGNVLRRSPIRRIDFADSQDARQHDRMVALVQEMIALHDRIASGKDDEAKKKTERRIAAVDDRIDRLVHGLYGLTEEESAVVQSLS